MPQAAPGSGPGSGRAGVPRRRRWRALLAVGLGLAGAGLAAEFGLRFLLFSATARDLGLGWRARHAGLYTPREAGEEYWKLRARLAGEEAARPSRWFDERFGWLRAGIDPATLAHEDEGELRGRRPVLLFGDSYAECVGGDYWGARLEQDELGARYRLLNYGVGGYGIGQILLLLEATLERFADQDPVVVVGILVDDDLDRGDLGLRGHPKPRFVVRDGALELLPIEQRDAQSYLAAHPLEIRSFAWRWLLFGSGLVPRSAALRWIGEEDHVDRKNELGRLLLTRLRDGLEARGHLAFVWLFHARRSLEAPELGWQETFLRGALGELGLPWVSSRPVLRAFLEESGRPIDELFLDSGPGVNHYTPQANEVVFEALRAGLEGRLEGGPIRQAR